MSALASHKHVGNDDCAIIPIKQMQLFLEQGFHLIPCGGEDGKKPLRPRWNDPHQSRMSLNTIVGILMRNNSYTYGIRLDRLCVVDCDTWNAETQALVAQALPSTVLQIRTSRGIHLYFAPGDTPPGNLDTGAIKIEFKQGASHFVLGPGSVRPDGARYLPIVAELPASADLPAFRWMNVPAASGVKTNKVHALNGRVAKGERNVWLSQRAAGIARNAPDFDDLLQQLKTSASIWFETQEDFPEDEYMKIAKWAWELRCKNRLYAQQNSSFAINRLALDRLCHLGPQAGNATFLYNVLVAAHGHIPNARFPISVAAMCRDGLLPFKKSTAHEAKMALLHAGLISRVSKGGYRKADMYQLSNPAMFSDR